VKKKNNPQQIIPSSNVQASSSTTNKNTTPQIVYVKKEKIFDLNNYLTIQKSKLETYVSGLHLNENFISEQEEASLIKSINELPWENVLKRRTQNYGFRYDYEDKNVDIYSPIDMPAIFQPYIDRMYNQKLMPYKCDQIIVNEYEPGQGISAHVDNKIHFDHTIASLSLASTTVMQFKNSRSDQTEQALLMPRSIIVLTGPARYEWSHEILRLKEDIIENNVFKRSKRISITFRRVKK